MVKTIYEIIDANIGNDETNTTNSNTLEKTQESNLDSISLSGTPNLDLNTLDDFEFIDLQGNTVFAGEIRQPLSGDVKQVIGFDYGITLGETRIRKNFKDQTPIQILTDVIDNYTTLTFVNQSSVTSSLSIPLYPSNNKRAIQIIDDMHKLLGTTHEVDINKNFNLQVEGYELNSTSLEVGVNCWTNKEGWVTSSTNLTKNLTVNGDVKRIEESELQSGTGSQTTFILANPYTDIRVEYPVGTKLEPTIPDFKEGDYEIRKETGEIILTVAPALGTDNIKIFYVYMLRVNFNITTIDSTLENPHHVEINKDYLKEVLECKDYAWKYYNKFKNPLKTVTLIYSADLNVNNFKPNQRISVIDTYHKVDGEYINTELIIKSVKRSFGEGKAILEITVGDSENFVYDADTEIRERIQDFNQNTPTAEIFNEGINMTTLSNVDVEVITTITHKKATVPQNILIYDIQRTYTNSNDYVGTNGFKYINGPDYIDLFEDVE